MRDLGRLVIMLAREALGPPRLGRQPEPTAVMDADANVEAFHEQGAPSGPLLPVYRFNALATSNLARRGGTVLDLGSGSGQYLAYLAARRPDLKIIGLDLSPAMVARGRRALEQQQLADRVALHIGDMTDFLDKAPGRVDLISTVFALHHLPTAHDLEQCLKQIVRLKKRDGCAVWIFDHARPRARRTAEVFPDIFTPDAPRAFQEDSRNSLIASFSFRELCAALQEAGLSGLQHRLARWMPLYQVHWVESDSPARDAHALWRADTLTGATKRDFRALLGLFPTLRLVHE